MITQTAIVKKVTPVREVWGYHRLLKQEFHHETVYTCRSLDVAYEWVKEHLRQLWPSEYYDIYYRYEES